MSKSITVVPAPDKQVFNYHCAHPDCKKWRPVVWYEPDNEAKKLVVATIKGKSLPNDSARILVGPFCSIECLEKDGTYKMAGEKKDGEEKEVDTGGDGEAGAGVEEGAGSEGSGK